MSPPCHLAGSEVVWPSTCKAEAAACRSWQHQEPEPRQVQRARRLAPLRPRAVLTCCTCSIECTSSSSSVVACICMRKPGAGCEVQLGTQPLRGT